MEALNPRGKNVYINKNLFETANLNLWEREPGKGLKQGPGRGEFGPNWRGIILGEWKRGVEGER